MSSWQVPSICHSYAARTGTTKSMPSVNRFNASFTQLKAVVFVRFGKSCWRNQVKSSIFWFHEKICSKRCSRLYYLLKSTSHHKWQIQKAIISHPFCFWFLVEISFGNKQPNGWFVAFFLLLDDLLASIRADKNGHCRQCLSPDCLGVGDLCYGVPPWVFHGKCQLI